MRIAILEDDLSQLELIVQWVNQAGHNALPFHDAMRSTPYGRTAA